MCRIITMQLTTFHSISHLFVLCMYSVHAFVCVCVRACVHACVYVCLSVLHCYVYVEGCYIVAYNIATWSHYNACHVHRQDQHHLLQPSPHHTQQPLHQKLTSHLNTASAQSTACAGKMPYQMMKRRKKE